MHPPLVYIYIICNISVYMTQVKYAFKRILNNIYIKAKIDTCYVKIISFTFVIYFHIFCSVVISPIPREKLFTYIC